MWKEVYRNTCYLLQLQKQQWELLRYLTYCCLVVACVCWFCSDCCCSLHHLSRMANLSQFMATHGNKVVLLQSFIMYLFCCWATIVIEEHCPLINFQHRLIESSTTKRPEVVTIWHYMNNNKNKEEKLED